MSRERRLGRGLEALLGRSAESAEPQQPLAEDAQFGMGDSSQTPEPPAYEGDISDFDETPPHEAVDGGAAVTRSEDGQQWLPVSGV
ncbi:MAG: hypothetical protein AAF961_12905, partial [Planctomycetota bacterium]